MKNFEDWLGDLSLELSGGDVEQWTAEDKEEQTIAYEVENNWRIT